MHGERVVLHRSPTVDDVRNVYAPINYWKPQGTLPPPPPPNTNNNRGQLQVNVKPIGDSK